MAPLAGLSFGCFGRHGLERLYETQVTKVVSALVDCVAVVELRVPSPSLSDQSDLNPSVDCQRPLEFQLWTGEESQVWD